jgi:arginine/lysine/ornithine decarboxylase
VSAEMICPYPPWIPITAPGGRLTPEVVDYLEHLAATGVMVEGAADETLAEFPRRREVKLRRARRRSHGARAVAPRGCGR